MPTVLITAELRENNMTHQKPTTQRALMESAIQGMQIY